MMPFLSPFVGPGRLFNWLIRNQWHNGEAIAQLGQLPVLLISSIEVAPCSCLDTSLVSSSAALCMLEHLVNDMLLHPLEYSG